MKWKMTALMMVATFASLSADSGAPPDVAARARGAARIVVARIADVQAHFETNRFGDQLIVSEAVLEVIETWKGQPEAGGTVAVEGGTVGDLTLRVSDMPEIKRGDRAVFFLNGASEGRHTPNGRGHGILKLDANDRSVETGMSVSDLRQAVRAAAGRGQGGR